MNQSVASNDEVPLVLDSRDRLIAGMRVELHVKTESQWKETRISQREAKTHKPIQTNFQSTS